MRQDADFETGGFSLSQDMEMEMTQNAKEAEQGDLAAQLKRGEVLRWTDAQS